MTIHPVRKLSYELCMYIHHPMRCRPQLNPPDSFEEIESLIISLFVQLFSFTISESLTQLRKSSSFMGSFTFLNSIVSLLV